MLVARHDPDDVSDCHIWALTRIVDDVSAFTLNAEANLVLCLEGQPCNSAGRQRVSARQAMAANLVCDCECEREVGPSDLETAGHRHVRAERGRVRDYAR